jgi:hypothetical protein
VKRAIRVAGAVVLYFLVGALVDFLLFGEPNFATVGSWLVIVGWPLVIWWYAFLIALAVILFAVAVGVAVAVIR